MIDGSTACKLVDAENRVVGPVSAEAIRTELLFHRRSIVLVTRGAELFVRRARGEKSFDVPASSVERYAESAVGAAERAVANAGLPNLGAPRMIGKVLGTWGSDFAFITVFHANAGTDVGVPANLELIGLSDIAVRTGRSYSPLLTCSLGFLQETDTVSSLAIPTAVIPGRGSRVAVKETSNDAKERFVAYCQEIDAEPRHLTAIFDNERPYYPAPAGLEVGEIVLDRQQISTGVESVSRTIASYNRPIRLVVKRESGARFALSVEEMLRRMGAYTERLDVSTDWKRHGVAVPSPINEFNYRASSFQNAQWLNVICDTMISSGVTARAISEELARNGVTGDVHCAVLVDVERPRYFNPVAVHAVANYRGPEWLVGAGADAKVKGLELCREWSCVVALKPKGMGSRERLQGHFASTAPSNRSL